MSAFSHACIALSWETKCRLLQETKHPNTRQRALDTLWRAYDRYIRKICCTHPWAQEWGFEDAYQEAVTNFCERAIATEDPAELDSFWSIRSAVKQGAAQNIYPLSVSPHIASKKLQKSTFCSNSEEKLTTRQTEDNDGLLNIFDELGWQQLRQLCESKYKSSQNFKLILNLLFNNPGYIPNSDILAQYLQVSKATAQRYWDALRNLLKKDFDIKHWLQQSGLFIQEKIKTKYPIIVTDKKQAKQDHNATDIKNTIKQRWHELKINLGKFSTNISVASTRLITQYSQKRTDLFGHYPSTQISAKNTVEKPLTAISTYPQKFLQSDLKELSRQVNGQDSHQSIYENQNYSILDQSMPSIIPPADTPNFDNIHLKLTQDEQEVQAPGSQFNSLYDELIDIAETLINELTFYIKRSKDNQAQFQKIQVLKGQYKHLLNRFLKL